MKKRIGLIFGGQSDERFVSKKSAEAVKKYIDKSKYSITEIEITPAANSIRNLATKVRGIDQALLVLHGPGGEDGKVQAVLDLLKVRYNSSGVLASALAMSKYMSKQFAVQAGLRVASGKLLRRKTKVIFAGKSVVKPNTVGSSLGVSIVESRKDLTKALNKAFDYDEEVLIEKFIPGKEFTVPVLNGEALPVVEIIPSSSKFFDYDAKYKPGGSEEIVPARINNTLTKQIQKMAVDIHNSLGCRGLTRSDFILSGNQFYFLEINTIPGMTEASLAPKSAKAAGISFTKLIDRLIESS
jgi:D-alanine-D-alanine ligase